MQFRSITSVKEQVINCDFSLDQEEKCFLFFVPYKSMIDFFFFSRYFEFSGFCFDQSVI
ncbi:hypothetical protein B834_1037 [Enterococcus mundtii 1A]|nr:hypothetical protein [Enterococcus mundtii 1A]